MSWHKEYRTNLFDPYMAYLRVNPDKGVRLQFNDYFPDNTGIVKSLTLYTKWFSIKEYRSLEQAIIAGKIKRNAIGPRILGARYLEFGPRPRREMCNNTSGKVGVHHDSEHDRFIAFCKFKTHSFCYGPLSSLTLEQAETAAFADRDRMVAMYYEPIEDIRERVANDTELRAAQRKMDKVSKPVEKITELKKAA